MEVCMDFIKKILAPTDLSPLSAKAVRYACHLAKALQAQVTIAHVFNTAEFPSAEFLYMGGGLEFEYLSVEKDKLLVRYLEQQKQMLQQFVDQHLSDLKVDLNMEQVVERGEPYTMLVNWAKRKGVDLIVMSTHGRSGLPRMLLGSVTEKVLRSSSCPVLAIPSHEE
jgi:nucleotide-binding universal stress UspA family protein